MSSKKDQKEEERKVKDYFGMEPDQSLLSVNFATSENVYLNEHAQGDEDK